MFQRNRNGGASSLETPTILSSGGNSSIHVLERNMVVGPCPMLFNLIRKNKWKKVRRQLNSKKADILCKECDSNGVHVLGFAISYNAPIDILKLIVSIDPSQLEAVNRFLTNPLHVACMYCNSLETVRYLMNRAPDLASRLDKDGRTPLHHAVECLCIDDDTDNAECFEVVKALAEADPSLICLGDAKKNTPIDVLHLAWADTHPRSNARLSRILKLHTFLRKLSIQEYRRKKEIWEDERIVTNNDQETIVDAVTFSTGSSGSRINQSQSECSKNISKITAVSSIEAVEGEEHPSRVEVNYDSHRHSTHTEEKVKPVKKSKPFMLGRKTK